jgi:hypothetical protein
MLSRARAGAGLMRSSHDWQMTTLGSTRQKFRKEPVTPLLVTGVLRLDLTEPAPGARPRTGSAPRLLAREEPFAAEEFRMAFEDQDITVVTGARMTAARHLGGNGPGPPTLEKGTTMASLIRPPSASRRRTAALSETTTGVSWSGGRVKAWAAANGVPVIYCKAGEARSYGLHRCHPRRTSCGFRRADDNVVVLRITVVLPASGRPLTCRDSQADRS